MIQSRREFFKVAAMRGAGLAGLAGMLRGPLVRTVRASDQYSSVVLAKGPVGYWRLGESMGVTASDSSGNGYDGAYMGNPTLGDPGAINNDPDTAVTLHGAGSGDFVEIPDQAGAPFSQPTSGAGLTVEVWMRPDALSFPGETSDPYIHWLGKGIPSNYEWGFRFYTQESPDRPNRISAYLWNPSGSLGAGAYFQDSLVAGVWMHVVACYDPGDFTNPKAGVQIYRDGVRRLGPPSPGTLYATYGISSVNGTAPVRLGARNNVNLTFPGGLDEVAIYPRVLSPGEILENYTVGTS